MYIYLYELKIHMLYIYGSNMLTLTYLYKKANTMEYQTMIINRMR